MRKFRWPRLGQAGFSITEVLVAGGIMALIAYAMGEFLKSSTYSVKTLQAQDSTRSTDAEMCQAFNAKDKNTGINACTASLSSFLTPLKTEAGAYDPTKAPPPVINVPGPIVGGDVSKTPLYTVGTVYGSRSIVLADMKFGGPRMSDNKVGLIVTPDINVLSHSSDFVLGTNTAGLTIHWQQTGINKATGAISTNAGHGMQDFYRTLTIQYNPDGSCICAGAAGSTGVGTGTPNTLVMWDTSGTALTSSTGLQDAGGNIKFTPTTVSSTPGLEVVGANIKAQAFISTSDARLKTDVRPIEGLALISKLSGVRFQWRNGGQDFGVLAQEVEKVLPEAVVTDPQSGMKAVKYQNLVAPLIEAAKDLNAKVGSLEEKRDEDKALLEQLRRELAAQSAEIARIKADNR